MKKLLLLSCIGLLILEGGLQGMDMKNYQEDLNKQLIEAAYQNNLVEVKRLLNEGADVNYQSSNKNYTALMWAVGQGSPELVQTLIAAKANLDLQDANGLTALMHIINRKQGRADIMKMLIAAGANLDIQNKQMETALIVVCLEGLALGAGWNPALATMLLNAGANPNLENARGNTALSIVGKGANPEIETLGMLLIDKMLQAPNPYEKTVGLTPEQNKVLETTQMTLARSGLQGDVRRIILQNLARKFRKENFVIYHIQRIPDQSGPYGLNPESYVAKKANLLNYVAQKANPKK